MQAPVPLQVIRKKTAYRYPATNIKALPKFSFIKYWWLCTYTLLWCGLMYVFLHNLQVRQMKRDVPKLPIRIPGHLVQLQLLLTLFVNDIRPFPHHDPMSTYGYREHWEQASLNTYRVFVISLSTSLLTRKVSLAEGSHSLLKPVLTMQRWECVSTPTHTGTHAHTHTMFPNQCKTCWRPWPFIFHRQISTYSLSHDQRVNRLIYTHTTAVGELKST